MKSMTLISQTLSTRITPAQFLFSGRGPLRRAQIERLRERSDLRLPTERLTVLHVVGGRS